MAYESRKFHEKLSGTDWRGECKRTRQTDFRTWTAFRACQSDMNSMSDIAVGHLAGRVLYMNIVGSRKMTYQ